MLSKFKKIDGKKGDMVTSVIISIIILVISFFVVLAGFMLVDWTGNIDREACHESVILRATLPEPDAVEQRIIETPLECKTKKICITTNKLFNGDCEDDFGSKDYKTIRIGSNSKSGKQQEEIKKIIADEMYECWSMMGEGKIPVFSREVDWEERSKKCSICTRIAFDKSLKENEDGTPTDIQINGLNKYLLTTKIPDKQFTYWQYLTNNYETPSYLPEYSQIDSIDLSQKMIIFSEMRYTALVSMLETSGTIGGTIMGAKIGAGIGTIVPLGGTLVGGIAGAGIGYLGTRIVSNQVNEKLNTDEELVKNLQSVDIRDYNAQSLAAFECDSFENKV